MTGTKSLAGRLRFYNLHENTYDIKYTCLLESFSISMYISFGISFSTELEIKIKLLLYNIFVRV